MTSSIGEEGSEESTCLVARNDVLRDQVGLLYGVLSPVEFFFEGGKGESTADECGIIPDHHGAECSSDIWLESAFWEFDEETYTVAQT